MSDIHLHSTCVAVKYQAVLIAGKPGMGKTSLALQLIDRGAILVSDDQTLISLEDGILIATSPASLRGRIEVRNIGICTLPFQEKSPLALCVEICENDFPDRLPEPAFTAYHDIQIPVLKLIKNDPLGAIKVELRLAMGFR
ncbi:MAG: aldolase [Proteobacteria bacterium]|nr:aldolase [Pseudomonadota bacterium]